MKASELQIGDYVNYRGQIIKVTSLYDKGGSNEVGWSDKESVWVNGRCIEPIPLTAEILENNGFTRFGTDYILKGEHFGLDNPSIPSNYLDNYWLRISIKTVHIEYVHQLQHALRLCGITREIIL